MENKEAASGRLIKKYIYQNLMILILSDEGRWKRAVVKREGDAPLETLKQELQIGDLITISGNIDCGKDGKEEILASSVSIEKKTIQKAAETGLQDASAYKGYKANQYYHTLMLRDPMCVLSIKAWDRMMEVLEGELRKAGFCSVSTPILCHSFFAGGSRPFQTHMIDNDDDMYLSVTSEIAAKLLMAGGCGKIYEIVSYFRNGSVDRRHAVPFRAAEIYQVRAGEEHMRCLAEKLLRKIINALKELIHEEGENCANRNQSGRPLPGIEIPEQIPSMSFSACIDRFYGSDIWRRDWNPQETEYVKKLYRRWKEEVILNQTDPIWITDMPAGLSPFIARGEKGTLRRSFLIAASATIAEAAEAETDPMILEQNLRCQSEMQSESYPRDYRALLHGAKLGFLPSASLFLGLERLVPAILGIDDINQYRMYL